MGRNYVIISLCIVASLGVIGILGYREYRPQGFFNSSNTNLKENTEENYIHPLIIGNQEIKVELANTPEKITQGLSGRQYLKDGTGMLFLFQPAQNVWFWMPDMHFSIDIVFISEGKVVGVSSSVPYYPADYPKEKLPRYTPNQPVDMVLEVPAGWMQKQGLEVGAEVEL